MFRLTAILPLCACMLDPLPVDDGTDGESSSGGGDEASTSSTSSSSGPGSSAGSGSAEGGSDGTDETSSEDSSGAIEASTSSSSSSESGEDSSSTGGGVVQGDCTHDLCETGQPLATGCDAEQACVGQVCAADDYCCSTWWDASCVTKVATVCGLDC